MQVPSNGPGSGLQKFFTYLPFVAIGVAAFWFWGTISSFAVRTLEDTWQTIVYGGSLSLLLLFMWQKNQWLWMTWLNVTRAFTRIFIKSDPLSYMDSYADVLDTKLAKAKKIIINLAAKKQASDRTIDKYRGDMKKALQRGEAALKMSPPNKRAAGLESSRASGIKSTLDILIPGNQKMRLSLEKLNILSEAWTTTAIQIREEIARKREEYEMLKEQAKALNMAEAFINGNSPEGQIYDESVKALEEKVTGYIAYIEDFEKRSKSMIDNIQIDNQMQNDEGLKMLEEWMTGSLEVPNFAIPTVDVQYQTVSTQVNKPGKFNLLNNKDNQ